MPLILEDGTGVDGANSYNEVADADAFFADRNILNWAGVGATNPQKEGFLIQAADYLNEFFTAKGEPLLVGQAMGFPTLAWDGIPIAVQKAQLLLAREIATNGPISLPLGERLVTSERKQLQGVGEKEVHYETNNIDPSGRFGSAIWGLMRPYIRQSGWMQQARVDRG